jgi:hypothetical protein
MPLFMGGVAPDGSLEREADQTAEGAWPAVASVARGGAHKGRAEALDPPTRSVMEEVLHDDLRDVRLHSDEGAAAAAQALDARAFTAGRDITFAAGAYAPASPAGARLLAHELTHVVQQRRGEVHGLLQRQPEHGSSPAPEGSRASGVPAGGAAPGTSPVSAVSTGATATGPAVDLPRPAGEQGLTIDWLRLSTDGPTLRVELRRFLPIHGLAAASRVERSLDASIIELRQRIAEHPTRRDLDTWGASVSGTPLPREQSDALDRDLALREQLQHTLQDELVRLEEEERALLTRFEERAHEVTRELLDLSERQARQENARYGLDVQMAQTTMAMSPRARREQQAVGRDERRGVSRAAAELVPLQRRVEALRARRVPYERLSAAPPTSADYRGQEAQIRDAENAYFEARAERTRQYPILAAYSGDELASLAARQDDGDSATDLRATVNSRLANIAAIRTALEGGTFHPLAQSRIVDITERRMEIAPHSLEAVWIERALEAQRAADTEASHWAMVFGVLLGVLAAIPTAGAGSATVATVAGVASIGLNAANLADQLRSYQLESAATGTAFDRAFALSQEEPSFFWLALTLATTPLMAGDFGLALRSFRHLMRLRRAALAARGTPAAASTLALAVAEGNRLSPGAGERLMGTAAADPPLFAPLETPMTVGRPPEVAGETFTTTIPPEFTNLTTHGVGAPPFGGLDAEIVGIRTIPGRGQIIRYRYRSAVMSSGYFGNMQAFIRQYPELAAEMGYRSFIENGVAYYEFPTAAYMRGVMQRNTELLSFRPRHLPNARVIPHVDFLENYAMGEFPLAGGAFYYHDMAAHSFAHYFIPEQVWSMLRDGANTSAMLTRAVAALPETHAVAAQIRRIQRAFVESQIDSGTDALARALLGGNRERVADALSIIAVGRAATGAAPGSGIHELAALREMLAGGTAATLDLTDDTFAALQSLVSSARIPADTAQLQPLFQELADDALGALLRAQQSAAAAAIPPILPMPPGLPPAG